MDDLREAGEFSIDLYTMPDNLTTKLWDHLVSFTQANFLDMKLMKLLVQEGPRHLILQCQGTESGSRNLSRQNAPDTTEWHSRE